MTAAQNEMPERVILHLCADIGSDSKPYRDAGYNVILVGKDIGVENYTPPSDVYGVIANPVCTEFSVVRRGYHQHGDYEKGMFLVNHCLRIIAAAKPKFHVIENPATGRLRNFLGKPTYEYEPWWYGSPWTKKTALWGSFNIPERKYQKWEDVPKNENLYTRPSRKKPSMAQQHCNHALKKIPEFSDFIGVVKDDMSFRSLCSQNFAQAFFKVNP